MDDLTDREREILDFELAWWRRPGAKDKVIRERFNLTNARYYQIVNALLDEPAAAAYNPTVVSRLRRIRALKAQQMQPRRAG